MKKIFGLTTLLLMCAMSGQAFAQDFGQPNGEFGVKTGFYTDTAEYPGFGDITTTTAQLQLDGEYRVTPEIAVGLDLGVAYASQGGLEDASGFALTNPRVGARYIQGTDGLSYYAGLGVTIPVLTYPEWDDFEEGEIPAGSVSILNAFTRGLQDVWLYMPENLTLSAPIGIAQETEMFRLALDAEIALAISTGSEVDEDATEVLYQAQAEGAYKFGFGHAGARLGAVHIVTEEGDNFQSTAEPFVAINAGDSGYVEASFTMLLDGDASTFEEDGAWSANLAYRMTL